MKKILIDEIIDPKVIKKLDSNIKVFTNVYLDNNKKYPLIEIEGNDTKVIYKLNINKFIFINDNWVCEVKSGKDSYFHKFKDVKYHLSYEEEIVKDGSLNLYIVDRKEYVN